MMSLSEEIRDKSAKQKYVGHWSAAVVSHEMLEQWAKEAEDLLRLYKAAKILQEEFKQTRQKWKKEGSHVYEVLKLNEFEEILDSIKSYI